MTKILAVDEHPLLIQGLAALLTPSGYEITSLCRTAEEALDEIHLCRPDIILASLELVGMSGLELLKSLRADRNRTPFILYAGSLTGQQARDAIALDVNAIISKSAGPDELLICIATVERGQNWIDRSVMKSAIETKDPTSRWDILSPAEQRIASMAAQGLHNREIAERARLSEGTVKIHLNRVFRKLGISSRLTLVREYSAAA